MRCTACLRTTAPSEAKSFCRIDFCKRCYDALKLADAEKKALDGYLLSLSNQNNEHLLEALSTIASKFDKKEQSQLLLNCIHMMGGKPPTAEHILSFLLAAAALQESPGRTPLSSVGELALMNIASRVASDLAKATTELRSLDGDTSSHELYRIGAELYRKDYSICTDVLNHVEPSKYTEMIQEHINDLCRMLDSSVTKKDVTLPAVREGLSLKCSEDVTDRLFKDVGTVHVLNQWSELAGLLKRVHADFADEGIYLTIAEEDYASDIFLLVGEGEIFLTTEWEAIKADIKDIDSFTTLQNRLPLFVMEKAAGGKELFFELVKEVLLQHPQDIDVIVLYAFLLVERNEKEEAISFLEEKCSEIPDEPHLLFELANLFDDNDQPEKALQVYEKIAEIEPENEHVHGLMGRTHEMMKDFKKAAASYQRALELNPHSPHLLSALYRAETAAILSDIEDMISHSDYDSALKIIEERFDPFDITIFHYYKALVLARMDNPRDALSLLADYLDVFPDDERGWLEKAGIYLGLGQFVAASRSFRRCAMLTPHAIEPLIWEAFCHKRVGRSRDYKRCINKAKKIDPEGTKALLKSFKE